MNKPLIFGKADPKDYMEPLCGCGHVRSEHYDGQGSHEPPDPCWHGWDGKKEGCQCGAWSGPKERR